MLRHCHTDSMTKMFKKKKSAGKEIDLLNPLIFRSFKSYSNLREKKGWTKE